MHPSFRPIRCPFRQILIPAAKNKKTIVQIHVVFMKPAPRVTVNLVDFSNRAIFYVSHNGDVFGYLLPTCEEKVTGQ